MNESFTRLLIVAGIAALALLLFSSGKQKMTETAVAQTDHHVDQAQPPALPVGVPLSKNDVNSLITIFNDKPLTGGQVAPRFYKSVNENVGLFLQFNSALPESATRLNYMGISVKGVFCEENRPDSAFTHFHRLDAAEYAQGHGGDPGEKGYWLMWVIAGEFRTQTGNVRPSVDYKFSPTPAPSCGSNVPKADFNAPDARKLSKEDITKLANFFNDKLLQGNQVAPRLYKWVNEKVALFLQFDKGADVAGATSLIYFGISYNGEFCKEKQPSEDFPHFHRLSADKYSEGHGGKPGELGYWLLFLATDELQTSRGKVIPGVDRSMSPTPAPPCG
jgi:hypothetical protein